MYSKFEKIKQVLIISSLTTTMCKLLVSIFIFVQYTNAFTINGGFTLYRQPQQTQSSSSHRRLPSTENQRINTSPTVTYTQRRGKVHHWELFSTKGSPPPPLPNTEDPFLILGISSPTADKKVIKRAYRRMALKYHPDVRINTNSTEQEKKLANDDFAKINAAYAMLTGKGDESASSASTASSSSSRSNNNQRGKYSYTPPHRRTGQSTKSSYDWQDYMPKYDDDKYDTNGDSFGSIFSDLLSELGNSASTGGVMGGASILNDFVSFLEGNFPSVGNTQQEEEDIILNSLLKNGSFDEIKNELDDAKLLVKQLEGKQRDLNTELNDLSEQTSNVRQTSSYMDQMRVEERRREVEARKGIVEEYLDRAKVRQVKLKKRYDVLIIDEEFTSDRYQSPREEPQRNIGNDENAWKRESFGSSGRSRSRRSRSTSRGSSSSSKTSTNTASTGSSSYQAKNTYSSDRASAPKNPQTSYSTKTSTRNTTSSTRTSSNDISTLPPHRRISSRYEQNIEDKRRLREIKVDEEIDKMKKELGL